MSEKIEPSLESITVRGKYKIPETDFGVIKEKILQEVKDREFKSQMILGESLMVYDMAPGSTAKVWEKRLKKRRAGMPVFFSITSLEYFSDAILFEVECRPAMWFLIAKNIKMEFTENEVQEALMECRFFVKQIMSIFKGKEIEPVSVYPIIPRTEIKSRLVNLGLKNVVNLLDRAERHIVQNNFEASLTSSRTAFEKMVDWEIKKRGLEKTSNYKNDLERLRSRGHLDVETTKLLQSYYRCLSNIGVHERGAPVGIFEAQMGYGTTLIMLGYFANKLP